MNRQNKIALVKVMRKHTLKTLREIAEQLDISTTTAHNYEMTEVRGSMNESIRELEKQYIKY